VQIDHDLSVRAQGPAQCRHLGDDPFMAHHRRELERSVPGRLQVAS
jgi:hypothetical protein